MAPGKPNVILRGGPVQITGRSQLRYHPNVDETIKISVGNAYEHYLPTPETVEHDGSRLTVFEWTRRTYIAE
ncbi:DUF5988 family protein [Streptomyces sp. NBRC 109706]|uniref:DUF5988 family protein n=1 Tax=Streptomyces sp. NBRC 109706 TaxID=1550035 RepID=UPI00078239EB|nr:DUF5988 family protein [Streptomyces sp. NBRC 109706]